MRYVLLASNDETAPISSQERSRRDAAFDRFQDQFRARGTHVIGEQLQPSQTATTVRCWEGGDVIISAGSNGRPTEKVTGVFVVDCQDLDGAIEMATAIPAAWYGTVEVRPARPGTPPGEAQPSRYAPERATAADASAVYTTTLDR
jgi:hypothetical protein